MKRFLHIVGAALALLSTPLAAQTAISAKQVTVDGVRLDSALASKATASDVSAALAVKADAAAVSDALANKVDTVALADGAPPVSSTRNRYPLRYWGAKCDGTDQTVNLNAAFASGKPLFFDCTVSAVGPLVIQSGTDLSGANTTSAVLQALPSNVPSFITIAPGQIRGLNLANFAINGQTSSSPAASRSINAGQNGMMLTCQISSVTGNGGIWQGVMYNLRMRRFDGISLGFEGSTETTHLCPHQWLNLIMIDIERPLGTSGPALYGTGQVEHLHVDSSRLDGNGNGIEVKAGINFYLGRPYPNRALGTGTAIADVAPRVVQFTNLTSQAAALAGVIDRTENFMFSSTWFEDLGSTLLFQNSCRGAIVNTRFSNAATTASTGTNLTVNSSCRLMEQQSFRNGTNTRAAVTDGSGSIYQDGSMQGGIGTTTNVIPTLTIPGGTTQLNMVSARGVYLTGNTTGISISSISSDLAPGETFFIQMAATGTNSIAIASGGTYPFNIKLANGVSSMSMAPGETYFFMRSTVVNGWLFMGKI